MKKIKNLNLIVFIEAFELISKSNFRQAPLNWFRLLGLNRLRLLDLNWLRILGLNRSRLLWLNLLRLMRLKVSTGSPLQKKYQRCLLRLNWLSLLGLNRSRLLGLNRLRLLGLNRLRLKDSTKTSRASFGLNRRDLVSTLRLLGEFWTQPLRKFETFSVRVRPKSQLRL